MAQNVISIGLGNYLVVKRILAILAPSSAPVRRLKEEAKNAGRLVDASQGKKTRAFIITDSNHVVLSSISADTLVKRLDTIEGEE